jgi:hypothetical protein
VIRRPVLLLRGRAGGRGDGRDHLAQSRALGDVPGARFFTSAVLWLLLEAEFLAIVLVLVYVGAVMVLFLFVVMMLDVGVDQLRGGFTRYAPLGLLVAAW